MKERKCKKEKKKERNKDTKNKNMVVGKEDMRCDRMGLGKMEAVKQAPKRKRGMHLFFFYCQIVTKTHLFSHFLRSIHENCQR